METTKIMDCLELLMTSPIIKGDYHTDNSNMAGAIQTVVSEICSHLGYAEDDVKKGLQSMFGDIKQMLFQINTIAGILRERFTDDGYNDLEDLMHYYMEGKK